MTSRDTMTSRGTMTTLVVIAKECLPGRVKTRLHPPFSLEDAARIAHASLVDTLNAVDSVLVDTGLTNTGLGNTGLGNTGLGDTVTAGRRILFYKGANPPAAAAGYELMPQPEGTLDERIGAVFDACTGPTVLIGMDTPQLRREHLGAVFDPWPPDTDAWFGPAADGGFWALALAEPRGDLVRGVRMSRPDTGSTQLRRLTEAGLRVRRLPQLTDIDTADSLDAVTALRPELGISRTVREIRTATVPASVGAVIA
jgi:glycosyltransferase A (GT-A) superfamily protein (DUF2064 family)